MRARRLFVQVIKPTLAEGLLQSHLKDEWLFYLEETLAFDLCEDTERGVLSVPRFCYVFPCELQGPAWAVGSYSISQSVGGTSQNHYLQNLATDRTPALYSSDSYLPKVDLLHWLIL